MSHPLLEQTEAVLHQLDAAATRDDSPATRAALAGATRQLAQLGQQLQGLSALERQMLKPQLTALQGKIAEAASRLTQAHQQTDATLKNFEHHGQALQAYVTSFFKK